MLRKSMPLDEPLRLSANHALFDKRFHNVQLVTGGSIKYHWCCFRHRSTVKTLSVWHKVA